MTSFLLFIQTPKGEFLTVMTMFIVFLCVALYKNWKN